MYARIQTLTPMPERPLVDALAAQPGSALVVLLDDGTVVSLWHTREDAELASERVPLPGAGVAVYEVDADVAGRASARSPAAAFVGEFDGPLSPARVEAARFAGEKRVGPVLRDLPGLVRSLVMWHPTERTMVVLHLSTSVDALNDVAAAVTSTELLPGEDPALLPGPDRLAVRQVAAYVQALIA